MRGNNNRCLSSLSTRIVCVDAFQGCMVVKIFARGCSEVLERLQLSLSVVDGKAKKITP